MEQNRPEEKTIIEKALSRGQEVSFPVEEAPAKIELSLGGVRDERSGKAGIEPSELSVYNVSKLPMVDGYPVYDGFVIDPDCVRPDEQVVIGRNHNR